VRLRQPGKKFVEDFRSAIVRSKNSFPANSISSNSTLRVPAKSEKAYLFALVSCEAASVASGSFFAAPCSDSSVMKRPFVWGLLGAQCLGAPRAGRFDEDQTGTHLASLGFGLLPGKMPMQAMVLEAPRSPLQMQERVDPEPGDGQIRVKVSACGVCRTDLHVVDAELPNIKYPIVPGHEIVGRVDLIGANVTTHRIGDRVGIPWLGYTCGVCRFCREGMENLCDRPLFTGYTRDGGYATHTIAEARYAFPLGENGDDVSIAPLLCAGLIGWRSLVMAGDAERLGIYGFGAAGHIVAQVARWQGRSVYAFTRSDDTAAQALARRLGAVWAGPSDQLPETPLDAAIIYAPAGQLVPAALRAVRKGGRVVCAGIHMSDIPSFPYNLLWEERQLVSVANLTRQDGLDFLKIAPQAGIRTQTTAFPLGEANDVLTKLRTGQILGAAVLTP
jgi:propanol-preferring alcohol dehydrogenase